MCNGDNSECETANTINIRVASIKKGYICETELSYGNNLELATYCEYNKHCNCDCVTKYISVINIVYKYDVYFGIFSDKACY